MICRIKVSTLKWRKPMIARFCKRRWPLCLMRSTLKAKHDSLCGKYVSSKKPRYNRNNVTSTIQSLLENLGIYSPFGTRRWFIGVCDQVSCARYYSTRPRRANSTGSNTGRSGDERVRPSASGEKHVCAVVVRRLESAHSTSGAAG